MNMDDNNEAAEGHSADTEPAMSSSSSSPDGGGNKMMMMIVVGVIIGVVIGVVVGMLVGPEDLSDKVESLEDDLNKIQGDVDTLQTDLDTANEELENATSQIDTLDIALAAALAELDITIAELDELNDTKARAPLAQPHQIHLTSQFLNFACTDCHVTAPDGQVVIADNDLYFVGDLDSVDIRTDVNREETCLQCHGQYPTENMDISTKDESCTQIACHDDWQDAMDVSYVNEGAITEDDCLRCHGGEPLYATEYTY
jgi:Sec-independent protein translocase protein TatA